MMHDAHLRNAGYKNNMRDIIEQVIKKNLPEKKELNKLVKLIEENIYLIAVNKNRNLSTTKYEVAKDNLSSQFNELMNINTSLIADEVLKVVIDGKTYKAIIK